MQTEDLPAFFGQDLEGELGYSQWEKNSCSLQMLQINHWGFGVYSPDSTHSRFQLPSPFCFCVFTHRKRRNLGREWPSTEKQQKKTWINKWQDACDVMFTTEMHFKLLTLPCKSHSCSHDIQILTVKGIMVMNRWYRIKTHVALFMNMCVEMFLLCLYPKSRWDSRPVFFLPLAGHHVCKSESFYTDECMLAICD